MLGCAAHKSVGVISATPDAPALGLALSAHSADAINTNSVRPHIGSHARIGLYHFDVAATAGLTAALCDRSSRCGYLRPELDMLNVGFSRDVANPYIGGLGFGVEAGVILPTASRERLTLSVWFDQDQRFGPRHMESVGLLIGLAPAP